MPTNGSAFALLQTVVAPEMQGRVFTVVMSMAGAISPLSLAVGGPIADWLGGGALVVLSVIGSRSHVILNLEAQANGRTTAPDH